VPLCEHRQKLLKRLNICLLGIKATKLLGMPMQHFVALPQQALFNAFDICRC
jgi:hypothetical protein